MNRCGSLEDSKNTEMLKRAIRLKEPGYNSLAQMLFICFVLSHVSVILKD